MVTTATAQESIPVTLAVTFYKYRRDAWGIAEALVLDGPPGWAGRPIIVTGAFPPHNARDGFAGAIVEERHPKFGKQYKLVRVDASAPAVSGQRSAVSDPATDPTAVRLTVQIERIKVERGDSGWIAAYAQVLAGPGAGTLISISGVLPTLYPGCTIEILAKEEHHPQYGRQFRVLHAIPRLPYDAAGMQTYLQGAFKDVGPKRSAAIWDAFGMQTPEVLDGPDAICRLAAKPRPDIAPGWGAKIVAQWQRQSAERAALLTLASAGLSMPLCLRVARHFGPDTGRILVDDPYLLLEVDGISFRVADSVALRTGIAPDDPRRLEAGLLEACQEQARRGGHCWTAPPTAVGDAAALLGQDPAPIAAVLAAPRGLIAVDAGTVWPAALLDAECDLAAGLHALLTAPSAVTARLSAAQWAAVFAAQTNAAGAPIALSEEQQAAAQFLVEETTVGILVGGPGVGKALALDTPIPTLEGWSTMGALKVGDLLFDEHGRLCNVTFATEVMYDHPCYEVCFDDGSSIVADADHLWWTETRGSRKSAGRARPDDAGRGQGHDQRHKRVLPSVVTTEQIRATLTVGAKEGRLNHSIPIVSQPLFGLHTELPVDPYVLGYWLGNGTTAGGQITCPDHWVVEECERIGYEVVPHELQEDRCPRYGLRDSQGQGLGHALRKLGVLGHKHIPACYLCGRAVDRWALLQGLMDSDGCADKRGRCEITVIKPELADDIYSLVVSLGIKAYRDERPAVFNGQVHGTAYRTSFMTTHPVFRLPRKRERLPSQVRATQERRYIVAVRPVPSVPVRCIQVNSPSHLFLAGRACIPTHNTTVLKTILAALRAAGIGNIRLCAPTGKAAKRMSETTGATATTIHRLLGGDEEIDAAAVIVDEVSMLDLPLAARLVAALAPGTRLLFIGDPDQLPSVGPGRVLADLLDVGVPQVRLTQVFRQAAESRIIQAAYAIIRGDPPALPPATGARLDPAQGDALLMDAPTAKEIARQVVSLVAHLIPAAYGIGPADIRVLVPVYKGDAGIHALNAALQAALNPPAWDRPELPWGEVGDPKLKRVLRVGDRLLWLTNDKETGLVNGSEVEVCDITGDATSGHQVILQALDGDPPGRIPLRLSAIDALHGYAMSVHKSQGSEYPAVVMVCHAEHTFASRRLIYTGVTRAKSRLIVLGTAEALVKAVGRAGEDGRRTGLIGRLAALQTAARAA